MNEIIIDSFAGGGGASTGIEMALGRSPDFAINHDAEALVMHMANHPLTKHFCESVWDVDPHKVCGRKPVGLFWASPDCTFHSKARGGKPFRDRNRARRRRGLAWLVVRWAAAVRPRVIALENVQEFADWGPLAEDGKPCPLRKGLTFRRWVKQLQNLGYEVDMRKLRGCDYGAPTIRERLFIVARCDGLPIVWPEPTHGRGLLPFRTAADCIDWSIQCPSIFERKKPLADATLRRIARGIFRYVINTAEPFIVPLTHQGGDRGQSIHEPLRTVTSAHRGEHALIAPTLVQTGYGEREGQQPRAPGLDKPLGTVVAGGSKHALVSAFLTEHANGSSPRSWDAAEPLRTQCANVKGGHFALATSHLVKLKGTSKDGQPVTEPLHTVQAGGMHYGEVRAFMMKYYGTDQDPRLGEPMHTVPTKDRFGLVTVHGQDYIITDIGLRMLQPRELFRAQGFPDSYRIDIEHNGKPLTKTAQVRLCGNSVCPDVAAAIIRANYSEASEAAAA